MVRIGRQFICTQNRYINHACLLTEIPAAQSFALVCVRLWFQSVSQASTSSRESLIPLYGQA